MFRCSLYAALLAAALPTSHAATSTWIGPSGGTWSGAGNWSPALPVNGNDVVLGAHALDSLLIWNDQDGLAVSSLDFRGTYWLQGGRLVVNGPITALHGAVGIVSQLDFGASAVTITALGSDPIRLDRIHGSGELTFVGGASLHGSAHGFSGTLKGTVQLVNGNLPSAGFEGDTLSGSGSLKNVRVTGNLLPGGSNTGLLRTADVVVEGSYVADINGVGPGMFLDQVRAQGAVTLAGPLQVSLAAGFTPFVGETYTIIDNDGTDAVTGTFAGLPEGATFAVDSYQFRVSYAGGDGNDVVLTAVTGGTLPAPVVDFTASDMRGFSTYSVSGTCNLAGRPVTLVVGTLSVSGICGDFLPGRFSLLVNGADTLPEGNVTVTVQHGATGGPQGQHTLTVVKDSLPPALAFTHLPPITEANVASYGFSATCEPGAQLVTWRIGSTMSGEASCPAGGTLTVAGIDLAGRLPDGSVEVSIAQLDAMPNRGYVAQSITKTINRQAQVIDFPALADRPWTPDTFAIAVTGGASGQLVLLEAGPYEVCHFTTARQLGLYGAGTCTVTATQAGSELYLAAVPVQRSFLVTKGAQALSFTGLADIVLPRFTPLPLSVFSYSTATTTFESLTPSVCTVTQVAAALTGTPGTCQLRATNPGDALVLAATTTASFQVLSPPNAITTSATSVDFGGQSMNTTSTERTITVTNGREGRLFVYNLAIAAPYAATHDCWDIAPLATCTVRFTFTPTQEGLVQQGMSLNHNGFGTSTSVSLRGSGERSLVSHFYASILGRAADAAGHAYWTAEAARLQALGANVNEAWFAMALSFFNSAEYQGDEPLALDYLVDLYLTFFNRAPDPAGLTYWNALLQQGLTRDNVLQSFLFSPEFDAFTRALFGNPSARAEAEMLMDFYRGTLGRLPDSAGYSFWLGRLRTAQCTSAAAVASEAATITQLFLTSPEYLARARTDAEYVSDLYNTFMRRGGDLAGQQFWVGQLGAGIPRDAVRVAFIGSPEFQARVQLVIGAGCFN